MTTIGRLLTEEQGRLIVRRVLSVDDGAAKVETTFETSGFLHGAQYTALGTLSSFIRPDGTLYGELKGGLRTDDNDTVILAGVATNLAVESTTRASADLGYRTLVVSDACSTTCETAHDASLASMAMLAEIVTTDDLLAALDGDGRLGRYDKQAG